MSIENSLDDTIAMMRAVRGDAGLLGAIRLCAERAQKTLENGGRLMVCGNGGSLSQASHFAEEWTGRFRRDRTSLPAIAFSDAAVLTCIANDFGYREVFARQVEAHGRPGDLLVLLSTSGRSENLVEAAQRARAIQIGTVALTGPAGGPLADAVDLALRVPLGDHPDRIQEGHLTLLHCVVEQVERSMFPQDYADANAANEEGIQR